MTAVTQNEPNTPAYTGSGEAHDVLAWAARTFSPDIALACSFSIEDIAVLHMLHVLGRPFTVFALDTGRLNDETYECAERVRNKLGVEIEWYFPRLEAVEALERRKGLYSFRESLDNRRECCGIRKVEPLSRALAGRRAWVTGMRREQGVTRAEIQPVERDAAHGGMAKINPLALWTSEQVWDYVRAHGLPYNRLYDLGYTSIGCAPCTRAIRPGEDARAGRWWWEQDDHKECGLHVANAEAFRGQNI